MCCSDKIVYYVALLEFLPNLDMLVKIGKEKIWYKKRAETTQRVPLKAEQYLIYQLTGEVLPYHKPEAWKSKAPWPKNAEMTSKYPMVPSCF